MNVTCPECRSVFRVDPAKVPTGGVRARCAVCGGVMPVAAPAAFVGAPGDTPARSSVAIPPSGGWMPPAPTPAHGAPMPRPATPASLTPAGGPPAGTTPASATPASVAPASATPPSATPTPPVAAPPVWATPAAIPVAPQPGADVGGRAPTPAGTAAAGARPSGTSGRTINPFLANDPNQKAKRLARALVSDIVAYHPQLRDAGMRDGTLKQLFRDEIKKSYEEYVDQVGKEFAESTPHFQEALNEVLAGGRRMF